MQTARLTWRRPFELTTSDRLRVEAALDHLGRRVLDRWEAETSSFGFIDGKVGVAFALCELANVGHADAPSHAERAIVAAIDQFNAQSAGPSLHSGIAGLGWLIDRWSDAEALCTDIDESLSAHVHASPERPVVSLREGLIGVGLYASHRSRRADSARALLRAVSTEVNRAARLTEQGPTWLTPPNYLVSRGGTRLFTEAQQLGVIYEWSTAHGVAPMPLLLSQCEANDLGVASTSTELALQWLWATTQPQRNRFGWIQGDGRRVELPLNAWCTGDWGAILPMWLAAREAGLRDEADRALAFARELARRLLDGERPGEPQSVDLCCGLSSVVCIASSFAGFSSESIFGEAAVSLVRQTLDHLDRLDADALSVGFQFGLSGVVATLVSVLSGQPPSWAGLLAHAPPTFDTLDDAP